MQDNKYFCYTISENGERDYQKIDKTHALQLNSIGSQFY